MSADDMRDAKGEMTANARAQGGCDASAEQGEHPQCDMTSLLTLESLQRLSARLESHGRSALLAHLKECGVDKLPERQKVANAVAKHRRDLALPSRLAHAPLPSLTLQPEGGPPERWRVWSSASSSWQAMQPQRPATSPPPTSAALSRVLVVDDVLSREECARLVRRAEEAGFVASRHQGRRDEGFRRGCRAVLTDGGLAAEIFSRLSHRLCREHAADFPGWQPAGVWEQLRILSYDNGDFFLPHRDNACGRVRHCRYGT